MHLFNRIEMTALVLALTVSCCCLPAAVYGETESASREFFAMDTYMTVTVNADTDEAAENAADAAVSEVCRLDELLSTGNEDSEVSVINKDGEGILSADGRVLMTSALDLYNETKGLFDVSIFPVMELWGFTTQEYHIPTSEELEKVLPLVDASCISYQEESGNVLLEKPGMKIDFGGLAKGYTSERLSALMHEKGIKSALFNLGGNVQAVGTKPDGSPWRVGVQDPDNSSDILCVLEISDCAVITSGGYERFFEEGGKTWHHIIDPRTGCPAENGLASVTIVCGDGTLADGLSTSLFIMGEDEAVSFWKEQGGRFETVLYCEDGRMLVTEGLKGKFFSSHAWEWIENT